MRQLATRLSSHARPAELPRPVVRTGSAGAGVPGRRRVHARKFAKPHRQGACHSAARPLLRPVASLSQSSVTREHVRTRTCCSTEQCSMRPADLPSTQRAL